ncbi:MAG: pseudouridine synthase [Desulfovibrio sp.]|nr:pseudouridine synthase [Desulfovibrio sp.]
MTGRSETVTATPEMVGMRLDHALAAVHPEMGLRGRRRLIESGRILVNGRAGRAAQRLREGDVITAAPCEDAPSAAPPGEPPRLLARKGGYLFFFKPPGLHTVRLAGGGGESLETALPALLPDDVDAKDIRLLQRLDRMTSGIVCAAAGEDAALGFRRAEKGGLCTKRYLALLQGRLEQAATVRRRLDTDDCARSRALAPCAGPGGTEEPRLASPLRETIFQPLHVFEPGTLPPAMALCRSAAESGVRAPLTLAGCEIRLGARHQIRAHAGILGFPLVGDALYGGEGDGAFLLHHGGLVFPGNACTLLPSWCREGEVAALADAWLSGAVPGC